MKLVKKYAPQSLIFETYKEQDDFGEAIEEAIKLFPNESKYKNVFIDVSNCFTFADYDE